MKFLREISGLSCISVAVAPGAKKFEIGVCSRDDEFVSISLKSPPTKGKANKELISKLAKFFNLSKNQVEILRGGTSRTKLVGLHGLTKEKIEKIFVCGSLLTT